MSYYPQQQQPQHPPLPPPWYAEWDQRDQRYIFINPETRERTFEHPHPNYQQQGYGGYPQQGQGGYGGGAYAQEQGGYQEGYQQQAPPQKSHKGLEYGALGAVGGLVAGAFAMHEGEKIRKLSLLAGATFSRAMLQWRIGRSLGILTQLTINTPI